MLEINKIHQGNCLELMRQIDNESIDLVVSDPPYANGGFPQAELGSLN